MTHFRSIARSESQAYHSKELMRAWPRSIFLAAAAAMVATGVGSAGTAPGPALRFVRIDPLIVRGLDFRGNERVKLTARIPRATRRAHVTATAAGAFRVRLGRVRSYDPCAFTLFVEARGSLGSKASIRTLPRMCPVRQPVAASAAASVQVRVPVDRVCTNTIGGISLGVRWNGVGARRFRVRLYDPSGKVVLVRHGLATRAWKRWAYRPTDGGVYRTVYTLPGRTLRYRTRSLGCGG
jgi:hypothetical protein